ncbi:hypothetical protein [Agrobacterium larrymoorei]|uniref:Uncharacterized protein n=1 Tax=Agrobacterium larrymoorei TaxID=160699 RepID=A0AAF0H7B3_9HYPH|nr:hypothetical protein [Agrobacterium larrymoorei]WHA40162.1 hypothetical protein CFBP5477_009975 [Agrobacterium larrymoorei]
MARLAGWHPLAAVPEYGLVATMRGGVMDYGGGLAATGAIWMLGKEAFAGCFPLAVISTLARAGALLIECSFPFPVTGDDVLAALAR